MSVRLLLSICALSVCMVFFNNCSSRETIGFGNFSSGDSQSELDGVDGDGNPIDPGAEEIPFDPMDPTDNVSVPGEEDDPTGGNIVLPQFYEQASIVGQPDRVEVWFRASPDDTYIATAMGLPEGLSLSLDSPRKKILISGTPAPMALTGIPHEVELTLSNSTDSRTVKFKWNIHDGIQPDPNPNNIRPCGGNPTQGGTLWSWGWAGVDQEHIMVTESGPYFPITQMADLSGNGRTYTKPDGGSGHGSEPGGYTWRNYYTPFSTVGVAYSSRNARGDYGPQTLVQDESLGADKEFYLATAVMHTRVGGNGYREIFGASSRGNVLIYGQGLEGDGYTITGELRLTIDGNGEKLTPRRSFEAGPLLLEVWRDSNDIVHTRINGEDHTIGGGISMPGVFDLMGLSGSTGAGFDDAGFEFIVCKGSTSASRMDQARDYLRSKWKLY